MDRTYRGIPMTDGDFKDKKNSINLLFSGRYSIMNYSKIVYIVKFMSMISNLYQTQTGCF
jgi:hypothetical protein